MTTMYEFYGETLRDKLNEHLSTFYMKHANKTSNNKLFLFLFILRTKCWRNMKVLHNVGNVNTRLWRPSKTEHFVADNCFHPTKQRCNVVTIKVNNNLVLFTNTWRALLKKRWKYNNMLTLKRLFYVQIS